MKLFITFELKVFGYKVGETQSFDADFSICPKPPTTPTARPRRALKVNRLPRTLELNWLFSNLSPSFRYMTSFISCDHIFYLRFLLWYLWMTRLLHAHVNTCAHVCTSLTHVLSERFSALLNRKTRYIKRNPSAIILQLCLKWNGFKCRLVLFCFVLL